MLIRMAGFGQKRPSAVDEKIDEKVLADLQCASNLTGFEMIFSFSRDSGSGNAQTQAFPTELIGKVTSLVSVLACGQIHSPSDTVIAVHVEGELLSIPYRVYYDERQLANCFNCLDDTALIALCLGTRHHDGYVREQCVRRLLDVDERWTAPYVVQLLGEYVIEVIRPIREKLLDEVGAKYVTFFRDNIKYCEYLECRAISYWNEYYRPRFPKYKEYPAVEALAAIRAAA